MKLQNGILSTVVLGSRLVASLPAVADIVARGANTSTISWEPCTAEVLYDERRGGKDGFQCAHLEVPLDYTNDSNTKTIELDLIRTKSLENPSKGSILYNPGGPGGSGFEIVAASGQRFLEITGGQYDIVGFDPRGVGRTIPFICNSTGPATGNTLSRRDLPTISNLDIWDLVEDQYWPVAGAYADACYKDQQEYGRFVGSAFVARDMLAIVDALGQGDKLNFWGTSYGTVLGQVFLSMFPERVGRMVLDANLPAHRYFARTWTGSTMDTEKATLKMLEGCVEAGPDVCPLANYNGANTTGKQLLNALSERLEAVSGGPVPGNSSIPGELAALTAKVAIPNALYRPSTYPTAIAAISAALNGEWASFLAQPPTDAPSPDGWNRGRDAIVGVSCGDTSFRADDPDDLYSIYQSHLAQSTFGDALASVRLICARWKFSAAEHVDMNRLQNVRTSEPVLLVNGIYDPVTPIAHAYEVSAQLRNSRVLEHQGIGHGLNSHPSNCTDKAVGTYFSEGELPEVGTKCEPNLPAFEYAAQLDQGMPGN